MNEGLLIGPKFGVCQRNRGVQRLQKRTTYGTVHVDTLVRQMVLVACYTNGMRSSERFQH